MYFVNRITGSVSVVPETLLDELWDKDGSTQTSDGVLETLENLKLLHSATSSLLLQSQQISYHLTELLLRHKKEEKVNNWVLQFLRNKTKPCLVLICYFALDETLCC